MKSIFAFLLAPAIVSLLVSLYANYVLEARRARRDHITKLFEVMREDLRRGIEVAVDYFATEPEKRTPLQEAKVTLADRELRSAMPVILGPHPELANEGRTLADSRYRDLLAELTGGNFQEKAGHVDTEHIRRLTFAAAGLRSALATMRDSELRQLAETHPMMRIWSAAMGWLDKRAGLPPLPKP